MSSKTTTIYFLLDHQAKAVKIGRSDNLERRQATLQTGAVGSLTLLYTLPNVQRSFEPFLHSICSRYRIRGEWFEERVLDEHLLQHPWYAQHLVKARGA